MQRIFLYRLYQYSKPGFATLVIFILLYSISFYKKMDMVFFPYNAMFSMQQHQDTMVMYAAKINEAPVEITSFLYWKKDFLEESLTNFAKYKLHGNRVYMDDYLDEMISNEGRKNDISARLTPVRVSDKWLVWYAAFADMEPIQGGRISLYKYYYVVRSGLPQLIDSSLVTSYTN